MSAKKLCWTKKLDHLLSILSETIYTETDQRITLKPV